MEHQPRRDPTLVMEINCCDSHARKLKRWMEKIDGVISVDVDPENRLHVRGKIDPKQLLEKINSNSKFKNKGVTIVPSNKKQPNNYSRCSGHHEDQNNVNNKDDHHDKYGHGCDKKDAGEGGSSHENTCVKQHGHNVGGTHHKSESNNTPPPRRDHSTTPIDDQDYCSKHHPRHDSNYIHDGPPPIIFSWRGGYMPQSPYATMRMPPPVPQCHPITNRPPHSTYNGPWPQPAHDMMGMPPLLQLPYDTLGEFVSDESTRGCSIM